MKKLIIFALVCTMGSAIAQEEVKEARPIDANPQIDALGPVDDGTMTSNKAVVLTQKTPDLVRANEFSAYFTSGSTQFDQKGIGATYESKNGAAPGFLANYHHWFKAEKFRMAASFWQNQANFVEPATIGSRKVSIDRTFASLSGQWFFGGDDADSMKFILEAGAGFLTQNPQAFTGGVHYVPKFLMAGPMGGIGFSKNWPGSLRLRGRVIGMIPQTYKEYGQTSGTHDWSWYAQGSLFLDIHLNKRLSFSIGGIVEKEEHSFQGKGERGISSAKNSYMNYSFPLGVAYAF